MNATQENKLTPEQALQLIFEVTELDHLRLNAKERRVVDLALQVLKGLVDAAKQQPDAAAELTPASEKSTL